MKNYSEKIKFLLKHNPSELQTEYYRLCKILQAQMPQVLERTKEERQFEDRLNKITKLQYFTNFWIGPYNFDFFFPAICSKSQKGGFQGLVIEINGSIHHTYSKMNRDFKRVEYLKSLGIASTVIENWDINNPTARNLNYNIQNLPRLDFRGKRRLLNKVFYETLISNKLTLKKHKALDYLQPLSE